MGNGGVERPRRRSPLAGHLARVRPRHRPADAYRGGGHRQKEEWPRSVLLGRRGRPDQIDTIQAVTSGGWHLWFLSDGHGFQNKHSKQYDGIETKTGGGYVVVPPAPGRRWLDGKRTMLPAPEWLKELFPRHEPPPVAPTKTTTAHTPYGQKTLDRLTLRIAAAPRGEQDNTRTRLAYTIGQFVAGGEIEAEDGWAQIVTAARAAPTGIDRNALRKERYLRRSFEAGMRSPRSWATEWNALDAMTATLDAAAMREMTDER